MRNGIGNDNPEDEHERHKSFLMTNGSGAADMFFNRGRITGINHFACAGNGNLQRLTDGDLSVRRAG